MSKIKHLLFAFCLLFAFSSTKGQSSLLNYIPKDATFVVSLNPQNLNSKVNLRQLKEYDFYSMMMMQMAGSMGEQSEVFMSIMSDANSVGVDLMSSAHFFGNIGEENKLFGALVQLSDQAKFAEFLKGLLADSYDENYSQQTGYQLLKIKNDAWLAWTDKMVFVGGGQFDGIETEELADGLENTEEVAAKEEMMADWITETMSRTQDKSISSSTRFRQAISKPSDAHFWLDYAFVSEQMNGGLYEELKKEMKGFDPEMIMGILKSFYEDNNISVGLNFDTGKIALNTQSFSSPEIMAISRSAVDHKFNKKLARYIRGEDLMGYMSFSMSTKNLMEGYKQLIQNKLGEIPGFGDMAAGALDIIGIFYDEDALPGLFQGDMIMAVTGMQTITKTVTETEYDEEYNPTEVEKTVEQNLPEVTMIWSHKSKEDWMKFVNLGLKSAFLENMGSYFKVNVPMVDFDAYIALKDDVLIMSNSTDLITKNLDKGYSKKSRMSKAHCKRVSENSVVLYFDVNNIIDQINTEGPDLFGINENLAMAKEQVESIMMTSSKEVGNSINGEFSINLVNKEVNSLKHIFEMINDLFLQMMDGGSKT